MKKTLLAIIFLGLTCTSSLFGATNLFVDNHSSRTPLQELDGYLSMINTGRFQGSHVRIIIAPDVTIDGGSEGITLNVDAGKDKVLSLTIKSELAQYHPIFKNVGFAIENTTVPITIGCIDFSDMNHPAISFQNSENLTCIFCRFNDINEDGIDAINSRHINIESCRFNGINSPDTISSIYAAISLGACNHSTVEHCTFSNKDYPDLHGRAIICSSIDVPVNLSIKACHFENIDAEYNPQPQNAWYPSGVVYIFLFQTFYFLYDQSWLSIDNCSFENCSSSSSSQITTSDLSIESFTRAFSPSAPNISITNSTFDHRMATTPQIAMYLNLNLNYSSEEKFSTLLISGCEFYNYLTTYGAIELMNTPFDKLAFPTISGCTFKDNKIHKATDYCASVLGYHGGFSKSYKAQINNFKADNTIEGEGNATPLISDYNPYRPTHSNNKGII